MTGEGALPNAAPSAAILLDTENVFHCHNDVPHPKRERELLRQLRVIHRWLLERTGHPADVIRSYGKTVDPSVRALRTALELRGTAYREAPRHKTFSKTAWGASWQLTDFTGLIPIEGAPKPVTVEHADVPWGDDKAELRLIRDQDANRRKGQAAPDNLIGGGDNRLFQYVNDLATSAERERYLFVIPPSAEGILARIGAPGARNYPNITPSAAERLRVLINNAARQTQDPLSPADRVGLLASLPAAQPVPTPPSDPITALSRVDWAALAHIVPTDARWEAVLGAQLAECARGAFAEPNFRQRLSKSNAASGGSTISTVESGIAKLSEVRDLVAAAVIYDVCSRSASANAEVRRTVYASKKLAFLKGPLLRIQPLLRPIE